MVRSTTQRFTSHDKNGNIIYDYVATITWVRINGTNTWIAAHTKIQK